MIGRQRVYFNLHNCALNLTVRIRMLKCNASAGVFAKRLGEHHVRRWCVAVVNLLRNGMRVLVVGLDAGSPLHEAASYLIGLRACIRMPQERYLCAISMRRSPLCTQPALWVIDLEAEPKWRSRPTTREELGLPLSKRCMALRAPKPRSPGPISRPRTSSIMREAFISAKGGTSKK